MSSLNHVYTRRPARCLPPDRARTRGDHPQPALFAGRKLETGNQDFRCIESQDARKVDILAPNGLSDFANS